MPWPQGDVKKVEREHSCAPAATAPKDARCGGRGKWVEKTTGFLFWKKPYSFCTMCDSPFYGARCEQWRREPHGRIDVLIVVFGRKLADGLQARLAEYQQDLRTYE